MSFSLLFAADLVGLALIRRIWSIGSLTVLTTTYFKFDGQVYRQKFGAAMGEPCLSYHSYLFMEDLGQTVLSTAPPTTKPRMWKRYGDNVLAIVREDSVDQLKIHLNQADITGSIKFTNELEETNSILFLDTRIARNPDGNIKLLVYRKKSHTGQYLNFFLASPTSSEAWCIPHTNGQGPWYHHKVSSQGFPWDCFSSFYGRVVRSFGVYS